MSKEKTRAEKKNKRETSCKRSSIGGQAVIEGVMMRGERSMAIAVRDNDKKIRLETRRLKPMKERNIVFRIPVLRGICNFAVTMVDGIKTLMRSADVFGEMEPSKFEKWMSKKLKIDVMSIVTFFSLLIGVGLAIGLFVMLPGAVPGWFGVSQENSTVYELIAGGVKIVILFAYLLLASCMKDIRRTFQYHGAEHKVISCYEKGMEMTVENAQECSTLHNRCGTTFMFFVILMSVLVGILMTAFIHVTSSWMRIGLHLLALPVVAGLAYELLKALAKTDFWLVYPLKLPGLLLQKISTRQPTDDMVEVSLTAFLTVLEMDKDPSIPEVKFEMQKNFEEIYAEAKKKFEEAGIEDFADIDWICCAVLKCERGKLRDKVVTPKNYQRIFELVGERIAGKPLQYILSETEFFGYPIKLNQNVLIPRFETELLCDYAMKEIRKESKVLDLCTGSGCIAVAIAKEKGAQVTASDISPEALEVAKENARINGVSVEFVESNLFAKVTGVFDVIVSNPPYIRSGDIAGLERIVRDFEPRLALDGGADGLDFYRAIARDFEKFLAPKGYLFLEVGYDQAKEVAALFGKRDIKIIKDYSGIERIVRVRKK